MSFLNRPNATYGFKVTAKLRKSQKLWDGTREPLTVEERLNFLRSVEGSLLPVLFTDMWSKTFRVYVSRVSVTQSVLSKRYDERLAEITMVEAIPPARWDAFYWDAAYWG